MSHTVTIPLDRGDGVVEDRHVVWAPRVKLGTQPAMGWFLGEPIVGEVVEFLAWQGWDPAHDRPHRTTVERYDDAIDCWFLALR